MASKVVLDTNVFLNVINRKEPHYGPSKELLDLVDAGEARAIVSVITIAVLSTGYHLVNNESGRKEFMLHLLSSENYEVADVNVGVADSAGRIRAETGLRLPDSIIVASGFRGDADFIVTQDEESLKASEYLKSTIPEKMVRGLKPD
jgi:predicted nucleic acid-binding protein